MAHLEDDRDPLYTKKYDRDGYFRTNIGVKKKGELPLGFF
jgi:hypothetical protein